MSRREPLPRAAPTLRDAEAEARRVLRRSEENFSAGRFSVSVSAMEFRIAAQKRIVAELTKLNDAARPAPQRERQAVHRGARMD